MSGSGTRPLLSSLLYCSRVRRISPVQFCRAYRLPADVQHFTDDDTVGKNPERVQAGLKAATHNPNVSEEAKQSAAQRLEEMGTTVDAKHSTGSNYSKTTAQRREFMMHMSD